MNKELIVRTNSKDFRVFIQSGFYRSFAPTHHLHAHSFTELHFVTCESSVLNVSNKNYILKPGSMAVIPKGAYHCCVSDDSGSEHNAFQIDYETESFNIYNIGKQTINGFFDEIQRIEFTGDYSKFSAYVALFASYFDRENFQKAQNITNQRFLIREFFSQRYNENIHLSDLANALHVSERHAERLVIEHMGNPFKEELTRTRIKTAKNLLQTTSMTLSEIAAYVGYKSYSGFWKAMQKYNNE